MYDSTLSNWRVTAVNGISRTSFTAGNNNNNNISISNAQYVFISGPTNSFTITGIVAGTNGQTLTLYNSTSQSMTIANASTSSTTANRILTLTGANLTITGTSAVNLIYDTTASRWIVISSQ